MAWVRNLAGALDPGVEGIGEIQFPIRDAWRAEHHMASLAQSGEGFVEFLAGIRMLILREILHTEQTPVIRVLGDFFHQLSCGGQPAAIPFVIVFVEVLGDVLNQASTRPRVIPMENDGACRGLAGWVGEQPLVED